MTSGTEKLREDRKEFPLSTNQHSKAESKNCQHFIIGAEVFYRCIECDNGCKLPQTMND
jgi:hypothetical protein